MAEDRFPIVWLGCIQVVKYLIVAVAIVIVVLWGLPPLAHEIVGQQTDFNVLVAVRFGVAVNVATGGAAALLLNQNRKLRRRIRELEAKKPSTTPQQLPMQDGGRS